MKEKLSLIVILVCMVSVVFAKKKSHFPNELATEVKQVILLIDLTPEFTKELLEGKHPDIAVECKEGTELPIRYLYNNGFLSMKYAPNLVFKIEKTCYWRMIKHKGYLSFDLKNWKKPKNLQRLDTKVGVNQDKTHVLIETAEEPAYYLY